MGVVIQPPAFRNDKRVVAPLRRSVDRRRLRVMFARLFDMRLVAFALSMMALAWILALAGAAFAVRTVLVLCFATLAGRAQRVGIPAGIARRARPGKRPPNY